MIYLVDGNNVLGRLRLDRESSEAKRQLVRQLAAHVRHEKSRAIVFFDGLQPESFRGGATGVSVRFSSGRTADELIEEEAKKLSKCCVVTSDLRLAARVKRRGVDVVDASTFALRLHDVAADPVSADVEEWARFFSDDKNRKI